MSPSKESENPSIPPVHGFRYKLPVAVPLLKIFADRSISRNDRIMGMACLEFRGENFRGWLNNREIRDGFLPRKFPAIR